MYITKVVLENIRSVEHFEITFDNPSGWHVIIGDNGAGKSSIIRAIAIGLLGEDDTKALAAFSIDFSTWVPPTVNSSQVTIEGIRDKVYDMPTSYLGENEIKSTIKIEKVNGNGTVAISGNIHPQNAMWGQYSSNNGWFIAAYGPFRRLKGNYEAVINSRPRLGACITAFRDDVALVHLINWMKDLALDAGKKPKSKKTLEGIIKFINDSKLLPGGAVLTDDIDSEGIKLIDGNNIRVSLLEMSDGFRSILSMILDIIRFMIEVYGIEKVFKQDGSIDKIVLPGIVLIDEVDAHLHPSWQTEIGKWFTKYFPNVQFIVTTHSPLVCRACEKGSIWRLAPPGSNEISRMVDETSKQRLIYGNILDAYGTDIFGEDVSQSEDAEAILKELANLNVKSFKGTITEDEKKKMKALQKILPTN